MKAPWVWALCLLFGTAASAESWEELDAQALGHAQSRNIEAAIETGLAALEVARTEGNDERAATSLILLGEIHMVGGQLDEAERYLLEGKALWEQILPPLDYRHEQSMNLLAQVFAAKGDRKQAILWYQRSLDKAEKAAKAGLDGPKAPRWTDLDLVLRWLSEEYHALGETKKARQYHARALEALDRYAGEDQRVLHAVLGQSFETALTRDDLDMAEDIANRAISATSDSSLQRAEALRLLARVESKRDNDARELEIHRQALTIAESALPEGDHRLVGFLRRTALAESAEGHYDVARSHWERAVTIAEAAGDAIDPWTRSMALESLAWLYERDDLHAKAEPLRRTAVELLEGNLVSASMLADSRGELGRNLNAQGKWQEAKALFLKVVQEVDPDRWTRDRGYAKASEGLLESALRVGDIPAATQAWVRYLAWRRSVLGDEAPETEAARRDLAALERLGGDSADTSLPDSGEVTDASKISYTVKTIFERELRELLDRVMTPSADPVVQGTHLELKGELLAAEGRLALAAEAYDKALSIRITSQGRSHADAHRTAERLADLYQTEGRPDLARDTLSRVGR